MEKCTSTSAYLMKEPSASESQRTPLRLSDSNISIADLADVGVLAYKVDMTKDWESLVEQYSKDVGMQNRDIVRINPTTMQDFEAKLAIFFEEHLHTDPEVRFIIEGCGYFDVRNKQDRWVRIPVHPGDLLFLPAGIYHRFTTDEKDFVVAMRFFKDAPRWESHNRAKEETDNLTIRTEYVNSLVKV